MKQGKVPESVLTRSILKLIKQNREEVLEGPGIGEDCGILRSLGQDLCACNVAPVTGHIEEAGFRAVHAVVNNLAATGAAPLAVLPSILLPEDVKEKQLKRLIRDIQMVCDELSISILGGHTESTSVISRPIITMTGIGTIAGKAYVTKGAKPDQDIVMTKYAAMEGTALIAREKESELETHYSRDFISQAKDMLYDISVLKDAETAVKFGISSMHDARKGGIYGALWEFTSAAGIGMKVILENIPVRQETVEICEFYDLNPYKLLSGGSLLITADKGYELAEVFKAAGVPACVIGKTTKEQKKIIIREGEEGFLEPPKSDEIYRIL
ncbi:MAG: AIR synthase family protein [Lachnospiraceae bacterium]|nr:AIR synthase family protein [Lachnospiraceae bacterium]